MSEQEGLAWQTGVWDRISNVYQREIDKRFAPVVHGVVARGRLRPGEDVLDIGTGTGAVAESAVSLVAPDGTVVGIDPSPDMLALARERLGDSVDLREGRAEEIPLPDGSVDVVLASLSMMYVIDRTAAARELARVLRPEGRLVAAVWGPPERCDIVLFQQTAGRFAPAPPVAGVGPGALADPSSFVEQLGDAGVAARVEAETLSFEFPDFASAWDTLASVTTASLPPQRVAEAKEAVVAAMYPDADAPRRFRNETLFIIGTRGDASR